MWEVALRVVVETSIGTHNKEQTDRDDIKVSVEVKTKQAYR